MMQCADSVSRFFDNSPKRYLALDESIERECPEEKRRKLKQMCRTRWVERHESFEVFIDLLVPISKCLKTIARSSPAEWNCETRSDSHSLLLGISQFSFIFALVLAQKVLSYTKGLSVKLQGRYVDAVRAYCDIELIKTTLKACRSGVDDFHEKIWFLQFVTAWRLKNRLHDMLKQVVNSIVQIHQLIMQVITISSH